MHLPLVIRLKTSRMDRYVTADARDLSFRSEVPGGYASCVVPLDRPLILQPDEIAYYSDLFVYDGRSAETIWEGRLEDPGRGSGPDGEIWELTAVGPAAHAQDRTVPLIHVDRRLSDDVWLISRYSAKWGDVVTADDEDQVASIKMLAPRGTVVTAGSNDLIDVIYHAVREAGQKLARVSFDWDTGVTDTNWRVKFLTRTDDGSSPGSVVNVASNTAGASEAGKVGDTNFTDGHNVGNLRFDRDTSDQTIGNDDTWAVFKRVVVRAMLKDASGNDITSGYTADTVLASDIVKDLLGRLLTKYDGAGATVETTSYAITQFAHPDGVTSADLLAELMTLEPDYYWAAWESNSAGKHRFEWKAWPSTIRYEADVLDGFDSPGSADGLFNAVRVRWRDAKRIRTTRRTQVVAELDDESLTREAFIDLGDEIGSSANATQVGDKFLADHKTAPNAGTLRVAQPILDRDTGRMVMPWEIKPGYLISVRGVLPRVDALNATARDGVTVFRIVANEFSASEATATLELDAPPVRLDAAHAIADLRKRRITRRR